MKTKLTIIGAGPGSLVLALFLHEMYDITIIEKQSTIGGCWRVVNNPLFTEHSPKVIHGTNFNKILKHLDLNPEKELVNTYSIENLKTFFIKLIFSEFYIHELLILSLSYLLNIVGLLPDIYVYDWCYFFKINKNATFLLNRISILLADNNKRFLINDLFKVFKLTKKVNLYQLTNPTKWLETIQQKLKNKVKFIMNSQVISFNEYNCKLLHSPNINHDILICTIPPYALSKLLSNCNNVIKHNWGNIIPILDRSFYCSIGFQLHYKNEIPETLFSKPLQINTKNNIICLVSSKYNKKIKPTISCTIVDQTSIKTYNDIQHAINDLIHKINKLINQHPYHVTINPLFQNGERFISNDTSYIRQKNDCTIPYTGKLNNLFLVNSFNKNGITTLDKTIKNAIYFKKRFFCNNMD